MVVGVRVEAAGDGPVIFVFLPQFAANKAVISIITAGINRLVIYHPVFDM